jgi:hypothetical protein
MTGGRDYSREYQLRQKKIRRLAADVDRAKAEALKKHLAANGLTFTRWLNNQIDKEIK